jgi:hypothetical protein
MVSPKQPGATHALINIAARKTKDGWVIDATKIDGHVEQLIGVYKSKLKATNWIADHPAACGRVILTP